MEKHSSGSYSPANGDEPRRSYTASLIRGRRCDRPPLDLAAAVFGSTSYVWRGASNPAARRLLAKLTELSRV